MRRLVTAAVLLLLGSSAYAQTTCSATCRACGSTVVGGSGGAPTDAQYVTAAADATLSAERVCTDTTTIDCDAGTAGQMKFNLITPIRVATGCATPNFSFVDDSGAGICLNAANVTRLQIGTTDYVQVDANQFIYVKGGATVMTVTGNGLTFGSTAGTADWFVLTPQAAGAAGRYGELTTADLTANRTFTFPDATGDVAVIAAGGFPARTAAQTWAARSIAAGTGISVSNGDGQSGNPTVSVDTATTPQFSGGTGDVPATGSVGTFYAETDANSFYTYPSTNTEHWLLSIAAGTAQGDLFYSSAADVLSSLAKDTNSTRYLSNQGTSNNPSWNQVNLSNGVTGDLPFSNVAQASGASVLLGRGSAGGAGDFQEITLGSGLSMSGTALSASGGSGVPRPLTKRSMYCFGVGGNGADCDGGRVGYDGTGSDVAADASNGYLTAFLSAASSNAYVGPYTHQPVARVGRNLYYEGYGGISSTTDIRAGFGFSDNYLSSSTADPAFNAAYFRCDSTASDATWKCYTNDGTSGGTINDSSVTCNTTVRKFKITENPGTSFVFNIDGSDVCTNSTNLPTSGTNVRALFEAITTTTTAKTVNFGFFYIEYDK